MTLYNRKKQWCVKKWIYRVTYQQDILLTLIVRIEMLQWKHATTCRKGWGSWPLFATYIEMCSQWDLSSEKDRVCTESLILEKAFRHLQINFQTWNYYEDKVWVKEVWNFLQAAASAWLLNEIFVWLLNFQEITFTKTFQIAIVQLYRNILAKCFCSQSITRLLN